jgi:hypothetical protein
MDSHVSKLVLDRFKLGRERYSHGLLHPDNDSMNFRKELLEELLDAVIYAAADVVKSTPTVSSVFKITDDGSVRLSLVVNHEIDGDDGEGSIYRVILSSMTKMYDYENPPTSNERVLLLCLFALESVIKIIE